VRTVGRIAGGPARADVTRDIPGKVGTAAS
jgi:hypothetical protein